jgi:hypothetical protein
MKIDFQRLCRLIRSFAMNTAHYYVPKFGVVFLLVFLTQQLRGEANCPLKATAIPHILMYHSVAESENGWRPDYKMAVDIRIQNVSSSKIETATLGDNNYSYGGQWDISLEPGQSMTLYPQSVVDLGENPKVLPLALKLLKVKYSNGMIQDIYQGCDFGKTPVPLPMTVSQSAANPSSAPDWSPADVVSPPRQIGPLDTTRGYGKGALTFSILVTGYGDIRDVKIKQGSWGDKADAEETELVRKSLWFPAVKDDTPVPVNISIEVVNPLSQSQSQNYQQAILHNKAACEGGEMSACKTLGDLFSGPSQIAPTIAPDYQQAVKYYNIACDGGAMNSCMALGLMFEEAKGVPRNFKEARRYFKKVCDSGDQNACVAERSVPFRF